MKILVLIPALIGLGFAYDPENESALNECIREDPAMCDCVSKLTELEQVFSKVTEEECLAGCLFVWDKCLEVRGINLGFSEDGHPTFLHFVLQSYNKKLHDDYKEYVNRVNTNNMTDPDAIEKKPKVEEDEEVNKQL